MPRTIAALYDTRAEAERAGALLASQVKARSTRIIGRDTAAAVDTLKIAKNDAATYRDGIRRGAHLLVAEVPTGTDAKRVVTLLEQSAGDDAAAAASAPFDEPQQGFRVSPAEPAGDEIAQPSPRTAGKRSVEAERPPQTAAAAPAAVATAQAEDLSPPPEGVAAAPQDGGRAADAELRMGEPQFARAGSRVRSFTCESAAEEQVSLNDDNVEVENRLSGRELSEAEVADGGLFKERVFEIAEMREEPVVTKVAVVREEVIVRKTVKQRTETVRDTVRHTEIEVDDLSEGGAATFFAPNSDPNSGRH
jgi:hypothetical protein